ncbi:MAG: type I 3-dehydroquinate dehydratase, partial [Candidatus Aminicenantes bacterium]|nr:type I 3-dehydroquinate dehydratase [Candidatus Aminicenantes bacterium]
GASYVDLELGIDEEYLKELRTLSVENGCKIIISSHDQKKTPSISELKKIYESCSEKGADIVKIACNIISGSDNARLLSLYDFEDLSEKIPLIAIGMGEIGKITRLAVPLLGAPFTYASLNDGKETAKGQISKSVLTEIYKLITDENN